MRSNDYQGDPAEQCQGKRQFATKAEAKLTLRRLRHGARGGQMAYRCPHCKAFHLGHFRTHDETALPEVPAAAPAT